MYGLRVTVGLSDGCLSFWVAMKWDWLIFSKNDNIELKEGKGREVKGREGRK